MGTEVRQTVSRFSGNLLFHATKYGDEGGNLPDPSRLTETERNRAVTLMYADKPEISVLIGATPGRIPRFFSFIFRPSLLCPFTEATPTTTPVPAATTTRPTTPAVTTPVPTPMPTSAPTP